MVMMKNGKPVVPGSNDKGNKDIYASKPNFEGGKKPKEMKIVSEKISIQDGFGNQFRAKNNSITKPSKNAVDEIATNGK